MKKMYPMKNGDLSKCNVEHIAHLVVVVPQWKTE